MHALFVHGMGRSPVSGWPLLLKLRRHGLKPRTLWYSTTFEDFATVNRRLVTAITALANAGDYVLIGHSLGGVLLRTAIKTLPPGTRLPRHLFLLASPIRPARLAQRLRHNTLYRLITGDCGQLLASDSRMTAIGPALVPTTAIAGVRGWRGRFDVFEGEPNDGVVSPAEVSADWLGTPVRINAIHTLLPSSTQVAGIIQQRMAEDAPMY